MGSPQAMAIDRLITRLQLDPDSKRMLDDLAFLASYKYDHYEVFLPGIRFMDQLALWLEQFSHEDRRTALELVHQRLIFISQREMQELAHFLYYNRIVPNIMDLAARAEGYGEFERRPVFDLHYSSYLRSSLFIGLSDGARIDYFRRHHIQLSQEQVIPYYRASHVDYLKALRAEMGDSARFRLVFLVDDFTASGYTLVRRESSGAFRGSLVRLYEQHADVIDSADRVVIAYYVATSQAVQHVLSLGNQLPGYGGKLHFLTALTLDENTRVYPAANDELDARVQALCDKYYRPSFDNANTRRGGSIKFGFGGSGLVVVTYSNSPNNSIYPIWLDRDGPGEAFTPLFRRIDRHRLR